MVVRRGEVYSLIKDPEDIDRFVVVLSTDVHNDAPDTVSVLVAPITRHSGKAFSVPTNDADPLRGHVQVRELLRMRAVRMAKTEGLLTGATMAGVSLALRDLFDLP